MNKKILTLTLTSIKYAGDSIGDDIHIEIEILGHFLRVDKIIKAGTTTVIDKEIGKFETDQKIFKTDIKISVIEKDVLFNDVGSVDGNIEIDTNITKPQQLIYKVQIKETRSILGKNWGDKIANLEIVIEVIVSNIKLYVPDTNDGWFKFLDENSLEISLPAYLKVKSDYIKNKREYFTSVEGGYRGQLLSAKLQDDGSSYFVSDVKHEPIAKAVYSISKKTLTLNDKKYLTVDYKNVPWGKGLYDIEIPDYPHPGGRNYTNIAPHSKVWFRIGHSGDKYIHAGSYSLGCVTIIEHNKWEEIYSALIKARKGDFNSVGVLEVID